LATALEDSDITVRRKVAFLLNTLLMRNDSEAPDAPSNLQTPGSSSAPVHPNSHAAMVSDPSSTMTSEFAVEALEERGLLQALVRALIVPVPYGQDGESEGDADFEEKVVGTLLTYLAARAGRFPCGLIGSADLGALKDFINQRSDLSERCGVTEDDMSVLLKAVEGV